MNPAKYSALRALLPIFALVGVLVMLPFQYPRQFHELAQAVVSVCLTLGFIGLIVGVLVWIAESRRALVNIHNQGIIWLSCSAIALAGGTFLWAVLRP